VQRLHPDAEIPTLAKHGDAGYDLRAIKDFKIAPGEVTMISTGLAMAIPPNYCGLLKSKSGLARIKILAWGGVIDSSY
jgi:dUTP pyrophosphatase